MSNLNPRQIALEALRTWDRGSKHADEILSALSQRHRLQGPDHALTQTLFYGVLRQLTRLDAIIDELKRGKMTHENRCVLRLGLFQLFHTDIPPHAAVNETVSLARGLRPVINGILRNAQRQRKSLEAKAEKEWPLWVSHSHAEFLVRRWIDQYGEEATGQLCEWNNQPPPVFVRTNRLAPDGADADAIVSAATHIAAKVPGKPGFYRLTSGAPPQEWLDAGLIYVQDPSTSVACDLLQPHPEEAILDACSAPGGKTALIFDRMKGRGRLLATDSSKDRLELVRQNFNRLGLRGRIDLDSIDWQRPSKSKLAGMPKFDAILADVPCSNTGVIRRRVDVRWRLRPNEFVEMQRVQLSIAESCLLLLKPGGRLVYSTCSLEPEENQSVVDLLLERHPEKLELETVAESLPWRDEFDGAYAARLRRIK